MKRWMPAVLVLTGALVACGGGDPSQPEEGNREGASLWGKQYGELCSYDEQCDGILICRPARDVYNEAGHLLYACQFKGRDTDDCASDPPAYAGYSCSGCARDKDCEDGLTCSGAEFAPYWGVVGEGLLNEGTCVALAPSVDQPDPSAE